jgi:hypothetical protein
MINKLNDYKYEIYSIFFLFVIGIKFTCGLEKILDITDLWDESNYLYNGTKLLSQGFPSPQWGAPVYAVWYFFFSLFQHDNIKLYYLSYKLITILLPILFFVALRRFGITLKLSLIFSLLLMIGRVNLPVWPKVSHFSLMVILSFFVLASYFKSLVIRFSIIVFGALLSSYVRPEYFSTFLILTFLYFLIIIREFKKLGYKELISIFILITLSLLLMKTLRLPFTNDNNRAFVAFAQHYSINSKKWSLNSEASFVNWKPVIKRDFGSVQSIKEAFKANPKLFFKHIGQNFIGMINSFFFLFFGYFGLLIYLILFRHDLLLSELKDRIKDNRERLIQLMCYILPALLSILVIFPREHYMLILGSLIIIACCIIFIPIQKTDESINLKGKKQIFIVGLILFIIIPYSSYLIVTTNLLLPNNNNVYIIEYIRELKINKKVNLLQSEGHFNYYLSNNFNGVIAFDKSTGFNEYLKEKNINMIILTNNLKSIYKNDMEWIRFIGNYMDYGFVKIDIEKANAQLLVSENLLQ